MAIRVFSSKVELAVQAANRAASTIRDAISHRGEARIIAVTHPDATIYLDEASAALFSAPSLTHSDHVTKVEHLFAAGLS